MFDVIDHFQYDRNVVSITLYNDRYVGHLLVEEERNQRRAAVGGGTESACSRSRDVISDDLLIAVRSLYHISQSKYMVS